MNDDIRDAINIATQSGIAVAAQERRNNLRTLRRAERKLIRKAARLSADNVNGRHHLLEHASELSSRAEAIELWLNVLGDGR